MAEESPLRKKLDRIVNRLENPERLMKRIGAILQAESQKAFDEESWDGEKWQERYPGDSSPKVNYAGVIYDLQTVGRSQPKFNRFQDRPANYDTGTLKQTISFEVTDPKSVVVGSNQEYATLMHFGGEFRVALTDAFKDRLRKWMYTAKGMVRDKIISRSIQARPARMVKGKNGQVRIIPATAKGKITRGSIFDYEKKLGFMLNIAEFEQNVIPRPFVGVPKSAVPDIIRATEEFIGGN